MALTNGSIDFGAIIAASRAAQGLPAAVDLALVHESLQHAASRALTPKDNGDAVRLRSKRSAA